LLIQSNHLFFNLYNFVAYIFIFARQIIHLFIQRGVTVSERLQIVIHGYLIGKHYRTPDGEDEDEADG
jgi:hypothetical protein